MQQTKAEIQTEKVQLESDLWFEKRQNQILKMDLKELEKHTKSNPFYIKLEQEKEKLEDRLETEKQDLSDKLDTLKERLGTKYGSMLHQVEQLLSKLDGVAQPYSILDNDIHFLKSEIEEQIVEIEKDLEE
jgi:chromosome segregation ATPase